MAIRSTILQKPSRLVYGLKRLRTYATSTSSVNATEISHFNSLASTWWDPYGSSRLLHLMNPLRHDFISSCHALKPHSTPQNNLRYLDIGCGGGIFAESAARLPGTANVTAIDPSVDVIEVAKLHARKDPLLQVPGRLEYLNKSIEDLNIPQEPKDQYDVVSLFEVIEHITTPAPFLKSCLPFVKPGGWLVLSTIARTWISWLTTKVVAEDIAGLVPRGTHDWSKYINESELRTFFASQKGWGVNGGAKTTGCIYIPGVGWRMVTGGEQFGNYLFGIRRDPET
ncbi:MAG: hypothetical protein L6R40_005348 [Gallowayella cf. fulva]|nr:MAG: hypothetical protein L6R40_005348 [Xanthomendoza cf. fulva]